MARHARRFVDWMFYEELKDKEKGLTNYTCLAIKVGTSYYLNGQPMTEGVAIQADNSVTRQPISIEYLYDFCRKVPQTYAKDISPSIIRYLAEQGEPTA